MQFLSLTLDDSSLTWDICSWVLLTFPTEVGWLNLDTSCPPKATLSPPPQVDRGERIQQRAHELRTGILQNAPEPAFPSSTSQGHMRPALLDREIENSREMLGQKSVNVWVKASELLTQADEKKPWSKMEGESNYTTLPLESETQKIPRIGTPVSEDVRLTCISHPPCVWCRRSHLAALQVACGLEAIKTRAMDPLT